MGFHNKNNSSTLIKNIQIEVSYFKSFCMSYISIAIEMSLAISIFMTLIFVESLEQFVDFIYFIIVCILSISKTSFNKMGDTKRKYSKENIKNFSRRNKCW